jgi:2',3'-cyclic-nucleotide 2'-phosphodiesterase (5'-nucleotidase family)
MLLTATKSCTRQLLAILVLVSLPASAWARLVQIIHTNDLHSYLEHGDEKDFGGYAAVKATIDQIKTNATKQGIESIVLDAGDFSEGSQFYLANRGEAVWRTLNSMGYDAVTLGNHDWLNGIADMNRIIGHVKPQFALLGANFIFDHSYKHMKKYLRPFIEIKRAGIKIAILGLTTEDFVYNWRAEDGFIWPAHRQAAEELPFLRERNDFVIALTHLGLRSDIKLVSKTAGIDLVVGGHSHTRMSAPLYAVDQRARQVPIVQTGQHGDFVGDLLIDLEPGQPLRIEHYRLIPVDANGAKDETVARHVMETREALDREYGHDWLREIVGYTDVPMISPTNGPTVWAQFTADAIREAGKAEVTIDIDKFYGNSMPAGPVTREQLFVFYPRVFSFSSRYGWTVYTTTVRGWVLELALKEAIKRGWWLNTSGLTYDIYYDGLTRKVRNLKVNGQPLAGLGKYKTALPEGIGRGIIEIAPALSAIFKKTRDTGIPIWFALEEKLRRVGTVRPMPNP